MMSDEVALPEPASCVLVGPRRSGKTNFLRSLARAFESGPPLGWQRLVQGRRLTHLQESSTWPQGQLDVPTRNASTTYHLQLGLLHASHEELELSILDSAGYLFEAVSGARGKGPYQSEIENFIRAASRARCLVVCCDVGTPSRPKVRLSALIDAFLHSGRRRLPRVGAKPWPGRESPWERAPRLELPFDRVLLLLTGIDALCHSLIQRLSSMERDWLTTAPAELRALETLHGQSAFELPSRVDLRALAELYIDGIDLLASSLAPDACLAISAVGMGGVEREVPAVSLLFGQGDPAEESIDFGPPKMVPQAPDPDFGIWESLLFMVDGSAVEPVLRIVSEQSATAMPFHDRPSDPVGRT